MKCATCKHAKRNPHSETGLECINPTASGPGAAMSCKPHSVGRHYEPIDGLLPRERPSAKEKRDAKPQKPRAKYTYRCCARKGCRVRLGPLRGAYCSGKCALSTVKPKPKRKPEPEFW